MISVASDGLNYSLKNGGISLITICWDICFYIGSFGKTILEVFILLLMNLSFYSPFKGFLLYLSWSFKFLFFLHRFYLVDHWAYHFGFDVFVLPLNLKFLFSLHRFYSAWIDHRFLLFYFEGFYSTLADHKFLSSSHGFYCDTHYPQSAFYPI